MEDNLRAKYSADDKLSHIIERDSGILLAMSRFGISLGFGDKTVRTVCREQGVELRTFLAVINFISFGAADDDDLEISALISYLDKAHTYFLDFNLPMIKRKLLEALGSTGNNELSLLIMKFYDEYVAEVRKHMQYENREVFGYVTQLLAGSRPSGFCIDIFAEHHHSIHHKLNELKNLLIRFIPHCDSNLLNAVLFDIINCERDLMAHCNVEDKLFVPAVRRLELSLSTSDEHSQDTTEEPEPGPQQAISPREREIIAAVANGLSNKQIADKLCISITTVTTHRRNIAQKLDIHSAAGITVYAVLNGIVNIEDLA